MPKAQREIASHPGIVSSHLRSDVAERDARDGGRGRTAGAAEGKGRRAIFADFSSRMHGKIFAKNSGAIVDLTLK